MRALRASIGVALVMTAGCHHRKHHAGYQVPTAPQLTKPLPSSEARVGYTEQGVASWYGVPYHGRPAADGEIYDMETLVAAHRLMPFNTWLRVTNLKNQKVVEVRVIDRGPFIEGRIIDLSKAAARQIDLLGPGVGPVRLEVIAAPADVSSNDHYAMQLGVFTVYANAEKVRQEAATRFGSAEIETRQGSVTKYRVLAGRWRSAGEAEQAVAALRAEGREAFAVRLDATATGADAR